MSKEEWTEPQEDLLVTWAEKSSGYAWLHQKSVSIYKKRNLKLSIPTAIFGYVAGITILLSNVLSLVLLNPTFSTRPVVDPSVIISPT